LAAGKVVKCQSSWQASSVRACLQVCSSLYQVTVHNIIDLWQILELLLPTIGKTSSACRFVQLSIAAAVGQHHLNATIGKLCLEVMGNFNLRLRLFHLREIHKTWCPWFEQACTTVCATITCCKIWGVLELWYFGVEQQLQCQGLDPNIAQTVTRATYHT